MNDNPIRILEEAYKLADSEVKKDGGENFLNEIGKYQKERLNIIITNAESFKAIIAVLVTSLTKKIETPTQDIRLHKQEFKNGYSGRTFDTKYVTPFLKEKFRRFSMLSGSGWLTRSLEQAHPFTLDFPGKIRDKKVKEAFLDILDGIETKKEDPKRYLIGLFILLIKITKSEQKMLIKEDFLSNITIERIITLLNKHFYQTYKSPGASRLPVIAIYSIYKLLMNSTERYADKKLEPLKSHLSSDTKSKTLGDIEIKDKRGNYFEVVEIKHKIPIDTILIEDAVSKIGKTPIQRYYMLTTAMPNIKHGEEKNVIDLVDKINSEKTFEIIVNGVISSIRYYLRLLDDPSKFLAVYTNSLNEEFKKGTEIKEEHIRSWEIISRDIQNSII
jgi:DNA (cytosine-5)-methyltransferase 1